MTTMHNIKHWRHQNALLHSHQKCFRKSYSGVRHHFQCILLIKKFAVYFSVSFPIDGKSFFYENNNVFTILPSLRFAWFQFYAFINQLLHSRYKYMNFLFDQLYSNNHLKFSCTINFTPSGYLVLLMCILDSFCTTSHFQFQWIVINIRMTLKTSFYSCPIFSHWSFCGILFELLMLSCVSSCCSNCTGHKLWVFGTSAWTF